MSEQLHWIIGEIMDWLINAGKGFASWSTSNNWPLVALGVTLIFRREIRSIAVGLSSMSTRVTKLGPVELIQHNPDITAFSVTEHMVDPTSVDVLGNDVSLKPFYDHLANLIENDPNITTQERCARAVRGWAFAIRARLFDNVARIIFETQIDALRKLAEKPCDKRGLRGFFEDHVLRALARDIDRETVGTFDVWINYLTTTDLIVKGDRGRYEITDLGHAFLTHLNTEQVPTPIDL